MNEFNSREINAIHHYGLQLFDSLILSNDGYFQAKCNASNNGYEIYSTCDSDVSTDQLKMKGSQFHILLPFQEKISESQFGCKDVNIKYIEPEIAPEVKYITFNENTSFYSQLDKNFNFNSLDNKFGKIKNISDQLSLMLTKDKDIYVFDILHIQSVELFMKSLLNSIFNKREKEYYIAIKNCTLIHIIEIFRMLAVFYDKKGNSRVLNNIQFFLYNEKREEFWIKGKNIKEVLNIISKVSLTRGYKTFVSDIFESYLRTKPSMNLEIKNSDILPFDIYLKNEKGLTVFEEHTKNLLEQDIIHNNSGFMLRDTHIRIGSKIHLNSFCEAELLFHNSYYTSKFSKIIMERLSSLNKINISEFLKENTEKIDIKDENMEFISDKKTLFIGYEVYSEMLVYELAQNMPNLYKHTIFTNKRINDRITIEEIRNLDKILEDWITDGEELQVVYIVPISTTLTTFGKIEKKFISETKNREMNISSFYFSIIEVKDKPNEGKLNESLQKSYWKDISTDERYILYSLETEESTISIIQYLIDIELKWYDALKCELCYPANPINEIPLIETNKTSVVPMLSIGMAPTKRARFDDNKIKIELDELKKIATLKDYLYFGHYERGSKHYRYYIDTERYFISKENEIEGWFAKIKDNIVETSNEIITYNIILSPLHSSNSAFVKLVHSKIFSESALLVHVDTDKEYRGNFFTKYKYLKDIYDNLCSSNINSIINVYYVDDEIIRGTSFLRSKSLIKTMFDKKSDRVQVNIFKKIIVLIDRLSNNTKSNYIDDYNDFYSFTNIRISHLRTHEGSCYLCQRYNFYDYARNNSVLIDLRKRFNTCRNSYHLESIDNKKISISNIFDIDSMIKDGMKFDGYKMFYTTHFITKKLDRMIFYKNDKEYVFTFTLYYLQKNKSETDGLTNIFNSQIERIIYIIVAMSSPFLAYRKACLEVIFDVILIIFEMIMFEGEDIIEYLKSQLIENKTTDSEEKNVKNKKYILSEDNISYLKKLNKKIIKGTSEKERVSLMMILMRQSVYLNSNFIIRYNNIIKILKYFNDKKYLSDGIVQLYSGLVFQLINSHSDESKSNFLEYEIIHNEEYINSTDSSPEIYNRIALTKNLADSNLQKYVQDLFYSLFFDNGKIYLTALDNIQKNNIKNIEEHYFLTNYVQNLSSLSINSKIEDLNSIMVEMYEYLKKQDEESDEVVEKKELNSLKSDNEIKQIKTIAFYDELSDYLTKLFDGKFICKFAYEYKDNQLECNLINETKESQIYEVELKNLTKYSLLSANQDDKYTSILNCQTFDFKQGTYMFDEEKCIIKFNGKEKSNYIYLIICLNDKYSNDDETNSNDKIINKNQEINIMDYIQNIKLVFLFYNMINNKIAKDFNNDLLQEISHMKYLTTQFEKTRAFDHNEGVLQGGFSNPLFVSNKFLFGYPQSKKFYLTEDELKENGWDNRSLIFGMFISRVIGKMNILLLSDKKIRTCTNWICMARRIEVSLKTFIYKDKINILNKENQLIEKENYFNFFKCFFPDDNNDIYLKNKKEELIDIQDFSALIIELIQSASKSGKKIDDKVCVRFWKENEYLCVANDVYDNFSFEEIVKGFKRKDNGISLAVLGESIFKFYENEKKTVLIELGQNISIDGSSSKEIVFKLPIYLK
ncbi:hypothetical protein [Candidatus Stoquefichus massiliensis]|uniref:hypothetical protein n=1 Tax=Candidatus Stoquefichus massiliensis TaxID=1470350 RepID=UPI0011CA2173|nr:hypothetical protein [Candidatus Stoquefichus massiliensis]